MPLSLTDPTNGPGNLIDAAYIVDLNDAARDADDRIAVLEAVGDTGNATSIVGIAVALTSPTTGQVLKYNGSQFVNSTDLTGTGSYDQTIDLRDYLPGGYVTNGTVDYSTQINNARSAANAAGKWLYVPAGVWQGSITLQTNDKVTGVGTLYATATNPPLLVAQGATDVWVTDVRLLGRATIRGITIGGSGAASQRIHIRNVRFVDCAPGTTSDSVYACYAGYLTQSEIVGCEFTGCGGGILVYRPDTLLVADNFVSGTTVGNGITMQMPAAASTSTFGYGVQIVRNRIYNSARMGIECANNGGNFYLISPIIAHNVIDTTFEMGISCLADGAEVHDNQLTEITGSFGIEIAMRPSYAHDNTIRMAAASVGSCIGTNNAPRARIERNTTYNGRYGIRTNCVGTTAPEVSAEDIAILDNFVFDWADEGISMSASGGAVNKHGGMRIEGNHVRRNRDANMNNGTSWPIWINLPAMASGDYRPIVVRRNRLIQASPTTAVITGTEMLRVQGSAQYGGTVLEDNEMLNLSGAQFGRGLVSVTNTSATANSLVDVVVRRNRFANLAQASNHVAAPRTWWDSNVVDNSTAGNLPTGATTGLQRVGSKTQDWPSLATDAQQTTTVAVTGAALGDYADASLGVDLAGTRLWAYVSAADTVTVVHRNDTGGTVDLASGTLRVRTWSA